MFSVRVDWLDFLAVQGTLKSLLQHHSSKASILRHSAFFIAQLSHPYMTTGKTIALSRWTFVGKVVSAVYVGHNFSSKEQASFNFMAAVTFRSDFGAQENKVCHCFHCFTTYLYEAMGTDALILVFWMLIIKPTFSLSSFTFIKRLLSSSSLSAIRVVSSAFLRLLIFLPAIFFFFFLPAILIPAYASSSPAFLMMYSAYKLNKQGDSLDVLLSQFGTSLFFHVQF